ncbi:MAG: DUF2079 domain-containing protein [Fuerstiella sp.]
MSPDSTRKTSLLLTCILFASSAIGMTAAVCTCLTVPEISGGVFPRDVSSVLVGWLGGVTTRNAIGQVITDLGWGSVFGRLILLVCILVTAVRFGARGGDSVGKQQALVAGLRQTILVFAVGTIWRLMWLFGGLLSQPIVTFTVGIAPLWLPLSLAFFVWIWWRQILVSSSPDLPQSVQSWRPVGTLLLAMLVWIGVSFWMNWAMYCQLFIPHGDSAMYEEHLWNVWHGKGFRSYLDQGLFLGEHIQVIHLLLLPLHMLWPSHLLLELAESIALASCSIPIYLMTRRYTQSNRAAALMGIAWLFYFPMHFLDIAIDQKTFRPIALGLPCLFWLIELAERRRFGWAFVCLILALSAKEDIALIAAPLLAVLAINAWRQDSSRVHNRRDFWALFTMSLGTVLYLVVVVLFVIPAFRDGAVVHYSRYFGDLGNTPGDLVKTFLSQPGKVVAQAISVRSLLYVFVFMAPLAFLPARRPLILCAGAGTFGMLSLLQFGSPTDLPPVPYHHFHAPLLVVVFWAATSSLAAGSGTQAGPGYFGLRLLGRLLSWARLGDSGSAAQQAFLVLCCCVTTSMTSSMMPCGVTFWSQDSPFGYRTLYLPDNPAQVERVAMVSEVLKVVPENARVASTDFIHTRLTHCERSYDYSNYLRAVNNYEPGVPPDTDYIVIDTRHKYSEVRSPADVPELRGGDAWELLPDTTNGAFLILKRTLPD